MTNDQNNYLVQCPTIWSDQYTTLGSKAAKVHNKSVGINCTKNGLCNINLKCKNLKTLLPNHVKNELNIQLLVPITKTR